MVLDYDAESALEACDWLVCSAIKQAVRSACGGRFSSQ